MLRPNFRQRWRGWGACLALPVVFSALAFAPNGAQAQDCNGAINVNLLGGPFEVGVDLATIRLNVGAGNISNGLNPTIQIVEVASALDCSIGSLGLCADTEGEAVEFVGISNQPLPPEGCADANGDPVTWSASNTAPGQATPNTILFQPSSPVVQPADTTCFFEYEVIIREFSEIGDPFEIDMAAGFIAGFVGDPNPGGSLTPDPDQGLCSNGNSGGATGSSSYMLIPPIPEITIVKEVSIDGGVTFFDANTEGDAPAAALGTGALYRLLVTNTGNEDLADPKISDTDLGLVNVPLPDVCLDNGLFLIGAVCEIDSGDAGFGALDAPGRCETPGNKPNIAVVDAVGNLTDLPVTDSDPANVNCVEEAIDIEKLVSLDGGPFVDADDAASAPFGVVGVASAEYQLVVTNTGGTVLTDVVISDTVLGLVNVPIPAICGDLDPGEVCVIESGEIGFEALSVPDRCEASGVITNTAEVDGISVPTGNLVEDMDPANVICENPGIEIIKEVSLNGGPFLDANDAGSAPSGAVGSSAEYRLTVTNVGTEDLVDVVINDPTLGLVDVPLPADCLTGGLFVVGAVCVIDSGDIDFGALSVPDRCAEPGDVVNTASAEGLGADTQAPVFDNDPAVVDCVEEDIDIEKQVSLDGGPFVDADDAASAPTGFIGADAEYQLVVTNTGGTVLTDVVINDSTLGLVNVPIPASCGDLDPGEVCVIASGDIGFEALSFPDRCDAAGEFTNIAEVDAISVPTGNTVDDSDPAVVICEPPPGGCLTRTPGFWGTHPHVTEQFLPLTVCGLPIDNTLAGSSSSSAEAMCISGKDAKANGLRMPQLQLIRHLTAAKLNIAATLAAPEPGSCSTFEFDEEVIDTLALIDDCEANYCGASASEINDSECLKLLDAFNNSEDTLDPFGDFLSPGPAQPADCSEANGNGVIVE